VLPALAKAAQLARAFDASLVLCQAIATPLYLETEVAADVPSRSSAAHAMPGARRLPKPRMSVSVSAEWDYPAYEAVVRAANRCRNPQHSGREVRGDACFCQKRSG